MRKYEEAVNDYTNAIDNNSNDMVSRNNRGNVYGILGKYEEAINDYQYILDNNPNDIGANNNIGNIFLKQGEFKKALPYYKKSIKINPNYKDAYYNLGIVYIKDKNLNEAKENFRKYLEINEKEQLKKFEEIKNHKEVEYKIKEAYKENVNKGIVQKDILFSIRDILNNDLLIDNEKLALIELIYYCYELMEKIKFKKYKNFKLTHYTRAGNLKFLLKKKAEFGKLRLSNATYMNDPEEGQIFKKAISKYRKGKLKNIFDNVSDMKNYTYLTCFCPYEKRDTLPMWVHYGDGCKGVGLVFNEKFFENEDLYKVQYIDIENFNIYKIDKNIRNEFKQIFEFLSKNYSQKNNNEKFLEYINVIINYISYFFKDKAYDYENEVRMIQFRDYESEDVCINEDFEVPRLYIEYDKEIKAKEYCEEIIVGSKGNFEEIKTYAEYVGVKKCTKSKIKYR